PELQGPRHWGTLRGDAMQTASISRNESVLLAAALVLLAAALFGPAIAQPPDAHAFADQRMLWGVPHAMDVLSNLPFAIAGIWGLQLLARVSGDGLQGAQRVCARLFFVGLL